MWRTARPVSLVLVVALCSCSSGADGEPEPTVGPGAATPAEAVEDLVGAINEPDFSLASSRAVPGQAALAALAEGATFGEVATALTEGDAEIAANFWAGFAQGTGSFLSGEVTAIEDGVVDEGEVEFHTVTLQPAEGGSRTIIVRDEDGYKVDLFASFGAGLAARMQGPVERLLTTQTAEARLILAELQEIVPSLLVAAQQPGTTIEASQQLLALVEVITRVG